MSTPAISHAGAHELDDLRSSVRALLATASDHEAVRAALDTEAGYDTALWNRLAQELGVHALAIPEQSGGVGFGLTELGVAFGELGRAVVPGPYFSSIALAANALLASGDVDAQDTHLPGIASGETVATLAVIEDAGNWQTDGFSTSASPDGSNWSLTGRKLLVTDGADADLLLVAAQTPAGPSLFAVTADAAGLTRTALITLDITRAVATIEFDTTPATLIGADGSASGILDDVLVRATTLLAGEQVGGARACLELSVDYARERVQFGRAIGSFQAIKHKCADMFAAIEVADAAAREAARALDGFEDSPEPAVAAAVAHAVCSDAFMFVAAETIQVHGGIGFTWEHPAHLYFRRAKSSQLLFGGPAVYHERVLTAHGI